MPQWLKDFAPILILLVAVTVVVRRLPKTEISHTEAFMARRRWNWLPVGLSYAFLYMARYNLTAFKNAAGMSNHDYGTIDEWGAVVYGLSFLLNGPLTDRFGGRITILTAVLGAATANLGMWAAARQGYDPKDLDLYIALYSLNMYFQSFGAVSIVKVNAAWFHLRERGTFGGIFGILISLGLYFAYDWCRIIAEKAGAPAVFLYPPLILFVMAGVIIAFVRDTPGQAGHADFDTGDAGSGQEGAERGPLEILKLMLTNPVILTITAIEFCSGFMRNGIMKWYQVFAKATGQKEEFVASNWGMLLCCAGIMGGVFAGSISDHLFHSRRGPVAAILYLGMLLSTAGMFGFLTTPLIGWFALFLSLCVIGVHGMLSGTASMDFGGKRNVGIVVGIIDGFVYLGSATQASVLKRILPEGEAGKDPAAWSNWPTALAPVALVGLLLSLRVWNARAQKSAAAH